MLSLTADPNECQMLQRELQRNSNHFLRVWRLVYSMLINDKNFPILMKLIASARTFMFEKIRISLFHSCIC